MVAKRSEYQNQYRSSVAKKHHDIYRENLALRTERRDREFMHTPLCWTELSPDDDPVTSENSEEDARPTCSKTKVEEEPDAGPYLSLAEIMAEAKEKADSLRRQRMLERCRAIEVPSVEKMTLEEDDNKKLEEKTVADKSLSIHDIVDKENRKLNQKIAQAYVLNKAGKVLEYGIDDSEADHSEVEKDEVAELKEKESNLRLKKTFVKKRPKKQAITSKSHKSLGKEKSKVQAPAHSQPVSSSGVPSLSLAPRPSSKRPERPDRQGRLSRGKRRPASASSSQHLIKPPFVAYGAADIEDCLAVHRTHNVLAPADHVYQPALRAKTRREEEQRRLREKIKASQLRASAGDLLDRLSAASLTPRDVWASEYSLQFHGYEPREYQKSVSARSVLPRAASASFQATHGGGCRVIHVD